MNAGKHKCLTADILLMEHRNPHPTTLCLRNFGTQRWHARCRAVANVLAPYRRDGLYILELPCAPLRHARHRALETALAPFRRDGPCAAHRAQNQATGRANNARFSLFIIRYNP